MRISTATVGDPACATVASLLGQGEWGDIGPSSKCLAGPKNIGWPGQLERDWEDVLLPMNGITEGCKVNCDTQVNWRWHVAWQRYRDGSLEDCGDPWVKKAAASLWLLQAQLPPQRWPLPLHPVAAALRIYASDSLALQVLEARILAQQGDREIAARCGLSADVVAAYAPLFFDVRGPGRKQAWMASQLLGSTLAREFKAGLGEALKLRAFFGGGLGVEAMIDVVRQLDAPTIAACTPEDCPDDELQLRYELAVALQPWSREGTVRRQLVREALMVGRGIRLPHSDVWQVLGQAKLSRKLRKEIRQLKDQGR
jgi:hypothetical protein